MSRVRPGARVGRVAGCFHPVPGERPTPMRFLTGCPGDCGEPLRPLVAVGRVAGCPAPPLRGVSKGTPCPVGVGHLGRAPDPSAATDTEAEEVRR